MAKQKENPIVVADREWAKDIPEWLMDEVKAERLVYGLASLMNGGRPQVGDAEVAVYLMTNALRQPLSSEYANIYAYLVTRLFRKKGKQVPEDIRTEELTDWEEHEFRELKDMIYRRRGGEISHPLVEAMKQLKKDIRPKCTIGLVVHERKGVKK